MWEEIQTKKYIPKNQKNQKLEKRNYTNGEEVKIRDQINHKI
jgi:hypothetical protein